MEHLWKKRQKFISLPHIIIYMEQIFLLNEGDRASFLQHIVHSFGCTYICLWSCFPQPPNYLYCMDGLYDEENNQGSSSSSGSLARNRRCSSCCKQQLIPDVRKVLELWTSPDHSHSAGQAPVVSQNISSFFCPMSQICCQSRATWKGRPRKSGQKIKVLKGSYQGSNKNQYFTTADCC